MGGSYPVEQQALHTLQAVLGLWGSKGYLDPKVTGTWTALCLALHGPNMLVPPASHLRSPRKLSPLAKTEGAFLEEGVSPKSNGEWRNHIVKMCHCLQAENKTECVTLRCKGWLWETFGLGRDRRQDGRWDCPC